MSATLAVAVAGGRIEDAPGDLLIAPFFEGDRPLRGPAARVDWRLCGLVSRCLVEGRLSGRPGEALLTPSAGRLATPRLMLLGLGPRAGFGADALADAAADAARRASRLRVGRLVLSLPPEAHAGLSPGRAAVALVAGVAEALARRPAPLRLLLWAPEDGVRAARSGAAEAVRSGALAVPTRLDREPESPLAEAPTPSGAEALDPAPSPRASGP